MLRRSASNRAFVFFLLPSGPLSHHLDEEAAVMVGALVQKGQGASSEVTPAARSCASQEVTHTHSGTSVSRRGVLTPGHNSGTQVKTQ